MFHLHPLRLPPRSHRSPNLYLSLALIQWRISSERASAGFGPPFPAPRWDLHPPFSLRIRMMLIRDADDRRCKLRSQNLKPEAILSSEIASNVFLLSLVSVFECSWFDARCKFCWEHKLVAVCEFFSCVGCNEFESSSNSKCCLFGSHSYFPLSLQTI